MRIPYSWLAEYLRLPEQTTPQDVAEAFIQVGHEVEAVHQLGPFADTLVIGRVRSIEELTEFKKPIRYCEVEIAGGQIQRIICGARNFTEGDLVVVALPGTTLPGGFTIAERKTYGRVSEGMLCSVDELEIGTDPAGIIVLPPNTASPGDRAVDVLDLNDTVFELAITPDRGYALSVRGLVRDLACAFDLPFSNPAGVRVPTSDAPAWTVNVADSVGCRRFVVRRVTGIDPTAPTPWAIRRKLMLSGIRSISLPVDITNYVMLETGQPLHAFDAASLQGPISVRRAKAGETLQTLDGVLRDLDPDDLVVCDESGPVSLAGVMGGATTEVKPDTTDILLEGANWEPTAISRAVRRHKLPSEAARRFERGVDPVMATVAVERAARLLDDYADGSIHPGRTEVGEIAAMSPIAMPIDLPDRVAGVSYPRGVTARRLGQIGCQVEVNSGADGRPVVTATPPTWRPDLGQPADLVEEVLRLEGYHTIPAILPTAPAGRGLTQAQRRRRAASRALAEHGYVEVTPFPFVADGTWDAFGLPADDARRRTMRLANPLGADHAELATTLLPGLVDTLRRNVSRGQRDVALFQIGQVVLTKPDQPLAPAVPAGSRPADTELAELAAALPDQPTHVGVILTGHRELPGWWGPGREASWADAVEAARTVAHAYGVDLVVSAANLAPWHPGRCAALSVGEQVVGYAGELHPNTVEALDLPHRTCAMELDLTALPLVDNRPVPQVSPYPPVLLDVAVVVDTQVPASSVAEALRTGAGQLLEDIRLFDVYTGEQLESGKRSLAYALRFRAPDRTLTLEEATSARDTALAVAGEKCGAVLRS